MNTVKRVRASQTVVTPAQVRDYLRLGTSAEDTRIQEFINASVDQIERYTGKVMVESTFDSWTRDVGIWLTVPRWPIISVSRVFNADGTDLVNETDYSFFQDTFYTTVPSTVRYTAGYLRPATIATNVVTLSSHGYSNGQTVTIDDVQYTVSNATTDTFEVSGASDGSVLVGVMPYSLKEVLIEDAANRYLRGSTEEQLSKEHRKRLDAERRQIGFA